MFRSKKQLAPRRFVVESTWRPSGAQTLDFQFMENVPDPRGRGGRANRVLDFETIPLPSSRIEARRFVRDWLTGHAGYDEERDSLEVHHWVAAERDKLDAKLAENART